MSTDADYEVIIVGAGPVGLLLGNLLGLGGIRTLLVEKSPTPPRQSMAIGITPPSLEILTHIGLAEAFIHESVKVDHACIFEEKKLLGELRFNSLEGQYPFILSLAQSETVSLLERNLKTFDCVTIRRHCHYLNAHEEKNNIKVALRLHGVKDQLQTTKILVGCDGHRSEVRKTAAIPCVETKTYPESFVMADFYDRTDFGNRAHLYFNRMGSLESFPLPKNQRRWILQRDHHENAASVDDLIDGIKRRSGLQLLPADCGELHNFSVHRFVGRSYYSGKITLCGDAAHVMSPIGGQGMNTGIADAEFLADSLIRHFRLSQDLSALLQRYNNFRRKAFSVAANRAERGMWVGTRRGLTASLLRSLGIRILFNTPLNKRLPPYFAMRTIPNCTLTHGSLQNQKASMLTGLSAIKDRFKRARNIAGNIDTPEKKRLFNQQHFAVSAKRYDVATRAMSLGRDRSWKQQLIAALPQGREPNCLDLATGSGDVALLLAEAYPGGKVMGIDLTTEMLQLARERNTHDHLDFVCADMASTGLADNSFDIITGSYALRNAADLREVLNEIQRLLKPGGSAAFLDFSKPASIATQNVQYRLLKSWCGLWGVVLHGDPGIHAYIADSLQQYPDRKSLHQQIRDTDLTLTSSRLFYAGMIELLVLRKDDLR